MLSLGFDVLHTGSLFDTRVEQDKPRSDGLLHRAEMHPAAGSVPSKPASVKLELWKAVRCRWLMFCAPGLSQDLEELMVEGLLLQVCLPEVQNLYHVLLDRASSQHTNRCTSPPQYESTDCDTRVQFNSQGNNVPLNQVRSFTSKRSE